MTDGVLEVGVIGFGWHAAYAHMPAFRDVERAEIVAISRRSADRLALAQKEFGVPHAYTDWREMLDQVTLDAVVVCTPQNAHVEPTVAALERGLHVLVEKPMALTSEDAQAMVRAAEKAGRVLMVGYNGRGLPSWRAAKRVLAAGTIGPIRQIDVAYSLDNRVWQDMRPSESLRGWIDSSAFAKAYVGDLMHREHWRHDTAVSGGTLVDVGTHVMDLMLWLAGAPPTQVVAFAQPLGGGRASVVSAQARLANGATLSLTFNDNVAEGDDFAFRGEGRLTAYGDRGQLTADWTGFMITEAEEMWVKHDGVREKVAPEGEKVTRAAAFVATVLDGAPNIAPAHEAAQVVALSEAIHRSAEQGGIVQIDAYT
ncbi:MAG: Gfo/Idh/MocA family oxidoreductase [Anaerolineae bacterium]|nr:Gfo/Idh/MocA family oxidoreductase [Anaerolineae bacterium]